MWLCHLNFCRGKKILWVFLCIFWSAHGNVRIFTQATGVWKSSAFKGKGKKKAWIFCLHGNHVFVIKWYYQNFKKLKSKPRTEVDQRNGTAAVRSGVLWHEVYCWLLVILSIKATMPFSRNLFFSCWSPACVGAWRFSIPLVVQVWIFVFFMGILFGVFWFFFAWIFFSFWGFRGSQKSISQPIFNPKLTAFLYRLKKSGK